MNDPQQRQELADFLRTRRARLSPAQVGLPSGARRRTPGLRREEVAELADVGLTWYTWLEQARDVRASADVLERLARALRLDDAERGHLFRLAARPVPAAGPPLEGAVPAALQRMLDGVTASAAYLVGRRWDILAWNQAACDIFGDFGAMATEDRNGVWLTFTCPARRRLHADWEQYAQTVLAGFRADYGLSANNPKMADLVERLKQASPEFAAWWPRHDVRACTDGLRPLNHPTLGRIVLEHTSFQVSAGPDLRLVVHTRLS